MTVRNVKKNLVGQQDLLPGVGPYNQTRRGVAISVDGPAKSYIELWKRSFAEVGLSYAGTFEDGCTVTAANQIVVSLADGLAYSWDGVFPVCGKVVPQNSTPASTGGVSDSGWLPCRDITLRGDLASPAPGKGVSLVYGALEQADLVLQPITAMASYNNSNVNQAWKDSVTNFGYVYFPGFTSALNTYNIVGDDPALHGTTVYVDDNVNLAFDWDYYPLIGSLKIHGHCKFTCPYKSFSAQGGEVDYVRRSANINKYPLMASVVDFNDCTHQTVDSDTWTQGSLSSRSSSAIIVSLSTGRTAGLFAPIDIGEAISAHVRLESGTADSIGLLLRCANGWIKIHRSPNTPGQWAYQYKQIGQPVVNNTPVSPPSTTLNSYSAGKASFGISLVSRSTFRFIVNGVSGNLLMGSAVGDIYEVGFICDGGSSGAISRVTGLCSYKTKDRKAHGAAPIHLAIYGDSTAEKWLSTFDMYLPQVMDGEASCRSLTIQNFSVAGETFAHQFARLQANGPGQASIICMVAGTNEGQGGTSADTFAAQVQQFIDYCNTYSRTPMLVEPWMWYSNTFIGGSGQASANYDGASELREAGKRVAVAAGAIYVSTTHELPAPLPEYFNSGIDPLLRDDIHQSELGYRLYAELIGSHIIEYISRVDTSARNVPDYWKNSAVVVSIGADSTVSKDRINVSLSVNAFTNGSAVLRLPRGCRPDRTMSFAGLFSTSGGLYGPCMVRYAGGNLIVDGLTQVTSTIYIDAAW